MSGDLQAFRSEARDWVVANCPPELRGAETAFQGGRREPVPAAVLAWCKVCYARGWTAPDWPVAYGGAGLTPEQHAVLRQVLAEAAAPLPLDGPGLTMIGPAILKFGTEAQKRTHLTAIAAGKTRWCQGFSESEAGSDLAALRTKAERDGAQYLVTGAKLWTTHGDLADWMFCLVRTDPAASKQGGISLLLIPMDLPGITVRPITLISGRSAFTGCFFDAVGVQSANLLGAENGGWTIAKRILEHERSAVSRPGSMINSGPGTGPGGDNRTLLELVSQHDLGDECVAIHAEAARIDIETLALACLQQRTDESPANADGSDTSILKYLSTELTSRRMELYMSAIGHAGLVDPAASDAAFGPATAFWLYSKSFTIAGGCSEIQLDIIARRRLGMG